jgi:hypothetical protein
MWTHEPKCTRYLTESTPEGLLEVVEVCRSEESYAAASRRHEHAGLVIDSHIKGAKRPKRGAVLGYDSATRSYFVR